MHFDLHQRLSKEQRGSFCKVSRGNNAEESTIAAGEHLPQAGAAFLDRLFAANNKSIDQLLTNAIPDHYHGSSFCSRLHSS